MSMINLNSKVYRGFWQLADPKIWVASTVPMAAAVTFSLLLRPENFSLFWCIVAFIGVYLIEIGKNALNEYIDYKSGVDPAVDAEHRTPFSGGKKTIVDGLLTLNQSLVIACLTFAAAALIGLLVVFLREFQVLYVGLAGFGLAILYSLPPFSLAYRGLGEITVGLVFGPLVLNGMYVTLTGHFDLLPILASLPLGLLIANVLWINQFPDYEADLAGGKRNGVVRMGKEKSVRVYALLFAAAYVSLAVLALVSGKMLFLINFLTIPLAIKAVRNAAANYDDIALLISSNAATVQIYLLTGILMISAALIEFLLL